MHAIMFLKKKFFTNVLATIIIYSENQILRKSFCFPLLLDKVQSTVYMVHAVRFYFSVCRKNNKNGTYPQ